MLIRCNILLNVLIDWLINCVNIIEFIDDKYLFYIFLQIEF